MGRIVLHVEKSVTASAACLMEHIYSPRYTVNMASLRWRCGHLSKRGEFCHFTATVMASRVSRARATVRVSVRITVRFTFSDKSGIGFPDM